MFNIINHSTSQTFSALSKNNDKVNTSSFQTSLNEAQGGIIMLRSEFRDKVYEKTLQNKVELSQNEYERSIRFLLDTMQKLLENMDKNSSSYEMGERFYESFLGQLNPEQFVLLEINSNEFKPTNIKAQRSIFIEQYKEKSIQALKSDDNNMGEYLSKLTKELTRYEASLKQIAVSAMTFFSIFESEIDDNLMQEIITHLATVKAYNDYKAYNIDLQDGSKLSWQYINGGIKIDFINLDANLTLENSNKVLTEMKNFKILLEMFKQNEHSNDTTSHSKDNKNLLKELLHNADDEANSLQGVRV